MEEEEEIKTNTFWSKSVPSDFAILSECLQLYVQPQAAFMWPSWNQSAFLLRQHERLSWLNHQGPFTAEQTFGNHRPATGTNSFNTEQRWSTLYKSRSVTTHGENKINKKRSPYMILAFKVCIDLAWTSKVPWCAWWKVRWSHLGGQLSKQWLLKCGFFSWKVGPAHT